MSKCRWYRTQICLEINVEASCPEDAAEYARKRFPEQAKTGPIEVFEDTGSWESVGTFLPGEVRNETKP
jgi:hypothetical protein